MDLSLLYEFDVPQPWEGGHHCAQRMAERKADEESIVQLVMAGRWAEQYYEEHSEFLDFPKRMVTPKPWQDPHPPAWMAASTESSAVMAGENGCGLLCFSIMQPLDKLKTLIDAYREAQTRAKP